MLSSHKNALHSDVNAVGLPHALFEVQEPDSQRLVIKVRETRLYFEVRYRDGSFDKFQCRFVPFGPTARRATSAYLTQVRDASDRSRIPIDAESDGWIPAYDTWTFAKLQQQFRLWLERDVRRAINEVTTLDLWSNSALPSATALAPSSASVQTFTVSEQQQIRTCIDQFASLLKSELSPTAEQFADIRVRLAYLSDAAERLNRFDWRALALSTVIGIGTTLYVDTATGRALWALFGRAFHVVGHLLSQ